MKIFSSHQRKIEPHRRYGSIEFRSKIRNAANYKRAFDLHNKGWSITKFSFNWRFWRNIAIIGLLVMVYFATISPYFKIATVEVVGNNQVSAQAIEDAVKAANNPRIFVMSWGRVNEVLTSQLPSIKEITEFDRQWPNKIVLKVVERNPGFVIKSANNYFLIDDQGVVVSQVEDPQGLFIVENQAVESFATNEVLPNNKLAPFLLSMNKQWSGKVSSIVTGVKMPNKNSNDVSFETKEGWVVLFDTTRAVGTQLNNLALLLNRQIPLKDRQQLAYIDLRLTKLAYYCFKASPCDSVEQAENLETNDQQ